MKIYFDSKNMNFKIKKSDFYSRFSSIEKYIPCLFQDASMDKPIPFFLEEDLLFVIKNRDVEFFKRVIDFQLLLDYRYDSTELIIMIAEHCKNFEPYIDYLYETDFPVVDNAFQNKKHDLISWLYLIRKTDVAAYLIKKHNYPSEFSQKANFTNYDTLAISYGRKEDLITLRELGFSLNIPRMIQRINASSIKKCTYEQRIAIFDFLLQNNFASDEPASHFFFISGYNKKRPLTSVNLCDYHSRYQFSFENLNLSPLCDKNIYSYLEQHLINSRSIKILHKMHFNFTQLVNLYTNEMLAFIKEKAEYDNNYVFLNFLTSENIQISTPPEKLDLYLFTETMNLLLKQGKQLSFEKIIHCFCHLKFDMNNFIQYIKEKNIPAITVLLEKNALSERKEPHPLQKLILNRL